MELMKLVAKLQLDDSGYRSGLDSAEAKGNQFTKGLSAMTVAAGQIIADIAQRTVAAIKDMIGGAIDAFADYQQLVGGIETLFKSSSGKMEEYAKNSFRTTGLSANKYMETAMSFSATLLQGVKGDTEKAADYTNMAILDMSDNANKMGTDMQSLQVAYAGFAKRNYSMLDNLKLGYGGTESEMIRLVNDSHILDHEITSLDEITFDQLILAIHTVQTEMGITGTTAKEAEETISGSAASMKAAWEDLLAAVGGAGDQGRLDQAMQNFKDSFAKYMENFLPTLTATIANSGTLVEAIAESIAGLPDNLLENLTNAALGAGTGILRGATVLMEWLIDQLANAITSVSLDSGRLQAFGGALGNFLGTTVANLINNLPGIVEGLFTIGVTLAGSILAGIWDGLFGSRSDGRLQEIQNEMNDTIAEATLSAAKADAILDRMVRIREKYGAAAQGTQEWKIAEKQLEEVLGGSKEIFDSYGNDVEGAITHLRTMTKELRTLAIQNALMKRLEDTYGLIGELETKKLYAEAQIEDAEAQKEDISRQREATAKAYAQELIDKGDLEEGSELWYAAHNTLETPGYGDAALHTLTDALENYYDERRVSEDDMIWNRSYEDDILSPELLASMNDEVGKLDAKVAEAKETITQADVELQKAEEAVKYAERACERAGMDLDGFSGSVISASGALSGLKGSMAEAFSEMGFGVPQGFWDSAKEQIPSKAIGMDYVPYDGFRAELHRGEAVLTAQQNADRGRSAFDMENALENAVRSGMSGMYLNMDGNRVADMTTRRTRRNISANEHARVRAMGG